jgi:hypothetical protein
LAQLLYASVLHLKDGFEYRISSQIALGVIFSWSRTVYHEFELLAGKAAPHTFLQLIVYKAATFSDDILKIDTVRAYHVRTIPFVDDSAVLTLLCLKSGPVGVPLGFKFGGSLLACAGLLCRG